MESNQNNSDKYAGFGRRILAYWVDFLILFPIGLTIQQMFGANPFAMFQYETLEQLQKAQQSGTNTIPTLISLAIGLAYFLIMWVNYDGATPGKRLMAIKIVKSDGSKLSYPAAFLRYIGYFVSAFVFGLGYLWMIWDKKKQAWHDKIAGTVVVKTDEQPKTFLALILALIAILLITGYFSAAMYKGFQLGLKQAGSQRESIREERRQELVQPDQDKIVSYAPSTCGVSVPVPKYTTDLDSKKLSWSFNEVTLKPDSFYVIEGNKLNVSVTNLRFKAVDADEDYGNMWLYCVDNTKNLTLKEYESLVLLNKKTPATTKKEGHLGQLTVIPTTLSGLSLGGNQPVDENGYIGLSQDGTKLLYIFFSYAPSHPFSSNIEEDISLIQRNLQYR